MDEFNEKVIIKCKNKECRHELKIPKTKKKLKITCPICRTTFYHQPFGERNIKEIRKHPFYFGILISILIVYCLTSIIMNTINIISLALSIGVIIVLWYLGIYFLKILIDKEVKWYFRKWFVLLMLYLIAPIGITLLWAGSRFKNTTKVVMTIIFSLIFIFNMRAIKNINQEISLIQISESSDQQKRNFYNKLFYENANLTNRNFNIPQIVEKWGEAVVLISIYDEFNNQKSQGSGFICNFEGDVITNYHVLESAASIGIKLINGDIYNEISLIAQLPENDLAILHIENANDFKYVNFGNSDNVQVGEQVVAIGNPFGLTNTISDGLISAVRDFDGKQLIQITAPISPGSSGGPLFNLNGKVIGITTLASNQDAQNINFAIPINTLKSVLVKRKPFSNWNNLLVNNGNYRLDSDNYIDSVEFQNKNNSKIIQLRKLVKDLDSVDAAVQWKAIVQLERYGPDAAPVINDLIPYLKSSDWRIRYYTAEILSKIGHDAKSALPILDELLDDPDYKVQEIAQIAINEITGQ